MNKDIENKEGKIISALPEEEIGKISGGANVLPDSFVKNEGVVARMTCPVCGFPMVSEGAYFNGKPAVKCTNPDCKCHNQWQSM